MLCSAFSCVVVFKVNVKLPIYGVLPFATPLITILFNPFCKFRVFLEFVGLLVVVVVLEAVSKVPNVVQSVFAVTEIVTELFDVPLLLKKFNERADVVDIYEPLMLYSPAVGAFT
ncbi:Uncharacterised protein [Mycoplasmoides gallisepticum]|uniref:Uncharacterized protein n=1 Tax=Mycoplasmoides gallisepticum TaxID=2096 RepID=A0A3B0PCN4_MYCGL|nr:Uncharacterised protein [Mycoplasmoides gallisepticum]